MKSGCSQAPSTRNSIHRLQRNKHSSTLNIQRFQRTNSMSHPSPKIKNALFPKQDEIPSEKRIHPSRDSMEMKLLDAQTKELETIVGKKTRNNCLFKANQLHLTQRQRCPPFVPEYSQEKVSRSTIISNATCKVPPMTKAISKLALTAKRNKQEKLRIAREQQISH